ncbi:DUF1127 domain-containing protein [Denitrobaculum tricleocarpae]|uniref:DUF1127 domain-containing protein n=1 Tax=Denitrobaculum tricleocarpae TaxID=2591009 RepID=A0A545T3Z4_9PROT|nr:DUF1127 domain-containing protein [Denitrobaculum tricleocarpae]TQV71934.1 DUF1127 domain-containing protein [Denitrobaculum tricleocarpae]
MTETFGLRGLINAYIIDPLWRLQKRNELRRDMEAMDSRALNDIGISRADISRIVNEAYPAGATRTGRRVSVSGAHAA